MSLSINRDRIVPAAAAVALQLLLGYALIVGLGVAPVPRIADELKIFDVPRDPPPPPPIPKAVPHRARAPKLRGAAAPPARRAQATPVVAPLPEIRIERPPTIVAAPLPGIGADASAGAAPVIGPGSGSGGQGNGTGSGTSGTGEGGGGGSHAEYLRGDIRDRDYPRAARDAGIGGDLTTRYVIGTNGRITDCRIVRSSGSALLDTTTCRLVMERFRYRPARDANGRKVAEVVFDDHHWRVGQREEPGDGPPPQ